MIIIDKKNNIRYDLSSVNGKFLDVQFGDGTVTSYSDWDAISLTPQHKGNYQTWETATIKILIKASTRSVLEKRISWAKSLFNYADVSFEEMGFDFHFIGELISCDVKYLVTSAVLTVKMQGRKMGATKMILFNFSDSTLVSQEIAWNGNARVPLSILMHLPSGASAPTEITISGTKTDGIELWSETIELKKYTATSDCSIYIDGEMGIFYCSNNLGVSNWIENYLSKFLPYIEENGDMLNVKIVGSGITDMSLEFRGRWV